LLTLKKDGTKISLITIFHEIHDLHVFLITLQNPPNFLVASELNRHERLEVVVPEQAHETHPEPEIDSLIDTAEPPVPVSI
jgi:hypothetical protein